MTSDVTVAVSVFVVNVVDNVTMGAVAVSRF